MLSITPHQRRAIQQYYDELREFEAQGVTHEGATSTAFQHLLAALGREAGWTLIPQERLDNGRRPDGTLRDANKITRGYWEAKDTGDTLLTEISKKMAAGYPTSNTIFEDTRQAVLYQNSVRVDTFDLRQPAQLAGLLVAFFGYASTEVVDFEAAEKAFSETIPELARRAKALIAGERRAGRNPAFVRAYAAFKTLCQHSLDPRIDEAALDDMLVQHLMTERLLRHVFANPDFTRRNAIADQVEQVITALTANTLNRDEFLKPLDRFYATVERAAAGMADWTQAQAFLNHVYERFFQGYAVKQADTHGIVTTPQAIVDFMCASVEDVLRREFGTTLAAPGVKIIDPCTGTGTFIVNLIRRIANAAPQHLERKYAEDLYANEVLLLPYYVAALNIEHAYYERMGQYRAFEGLCFADTLELARGRQPSLFAERNTDRIEREQDAPIMVVIGNPPYNVGQEDENENNKNRTYPVIEQRIRETYVHDSTATLKAQLYDAYVKFFRWATDRLGDRDGIVCFVSNNSLVDQITFDGMRQHLLRDFTEVYHLDLHGNVRINPKLSGTMHNVFGIQVGVGITIAVRSARHIGRKLLYHRVPEDWRREEKLAFLAESGSIDGIDAWQELEPDARHTWLTKGLRPEFAEFLPLGTKAAKLASADQAESIFKTYTPGVMTARDPFVYGHDSQLLTSTVERFLDAYNAEVSRWQRAGQPKDVDAFVRYDQVKWSEQLKSKLRKGNYGNLGDAQVRTSLYRPFNLRYLYYSKLLIDAYGQYSTIFPDNNSEEENLVICVPGLGNRQNFGSLVSRFIPS